MRRFTQTLKGFALAVLLSGTWVHAQESPAPDPFTLQVQAPKLPAAEYAPPGYGPRPIQDAPGTPEFDPLRDPVPEYLYRPGAYELPGVSPVPIADYGPRGYEPREFQDAPGAPEFTRVGPPRKITPEDGSKFVSRGLYPNSFLVPGSGTSFRLRGFVRVGGTYDFDPIGSRDDFVTNTIPVPQTAGQNQNISARFSRFALETWTPTSFHDWNVHTFIEGDFFNGPAQAVGGGGNPFRLRFAFVDYGYFRIGQQNTVFMDSTAFPMTSDFAGPRGLVNLRRPSARVTLPVCDGLFWAAGVEQPFSDITTNGLGENIQDVPDFASHVRFESERGDSLQISGLARAIGYRPTGGDVTRRGGFGGSASAIIHPWALLLGTDPVREENPSGLTRSRVLLQYTAGWGIGRYIQDTAGLGLDAQVDPGTGGISPLFAVGWSTSYEHWFNQHWLTNITYSEDFVGHNEGQTPGTYAGAKYLTSGVWWIPIPRMSIGAEFVWGERENLDEQRARARRIQTVFQYNF